jgi:hypothetical protein
MADIPLKGGLQRAAGVMAAEKIAQQFGGGGILDAQRILQASDFLQGALGIGGVGGLPQPLLGGISLSEARDTYSQLSNARIARKNLFFIQITDVNMPKGLGIFPRVPAALGGVLNDVLSTVRGAAGGLGGMVTDALGVKPDVTSLINLFATSVSYAPNTMTGERVHFGAVSMDKLTGTEPVELQVTTMDDEVGTIKRWFDAKFAQAAHSDGTFGLPSEYCVDIAIWHAVPKPYAGAYQFKARMRPQNIQHELSRSDQAMQEIQMTFSQFDTFFSP